MKPKPKRKLRRELIGDRVGQEVIDQNLTAMLGKNQENNTGLNPSKNDVSMDYRTSIFDVFN